MQYYVAVGQQKFGPFTLQQLVDKPPPPEALIWREGLPNWLKVEQVPELQGRVQAPLPPLREAPLVPPQFSQASVVPLVKNSTRTLEELKEIASGQRYLLYGLLACLVVYFFGFPFISALVPAGSPAADGTASPQQVLANLARCGLGLLMCSVQVGTSIFAARSLKLPYFWLWGIGAGCCIIGIIVMAVICRKATTILNQAGIQVGFLGANPAQFKYRR